MSVDKSSHFLSDNPFRIMILTSFIWIPLFAPVAVANDGEQKSTSTVLHSRMLQRIPQLWLKGEIPNVKPAEDKPGEGVKETDYIPGLLTVTQEGMYLSNGLQARLIARTGAYVDYESSTASVRDDDSTYSATTFHLLPDHGDTFIDTRKGNPGGWIYVSNSETPLIGGVGAITFDKDGKVIDYRRVLEGTSSNCGGGRTPWNTWITCEEHLGLAGRNWQVDPTGQEPAKPITLGIEGGKYESFAYNKKKSEFYVTEDKKDGALRRFVPAANSRAKGKDILYAPGETTYLRLKPNSETNGTYEWTSDLSSARANAEAFFPNQEGIDSVGDRLYFISKVVKTMFILNLEDMTYEAQSTRSGIFDGQPDQITRILRPEHVSDDAPDAVDNKLMIYFTEDGGDRAGVHARDKDGKFVQILEAPNYEQETTGIAFSPNLIHMYFCYQRDGLCFDVSRKDGQPFSAKTMDVKYHDVEKITRKK